MVKSFEIKSFNFITWNWKWDCKIDSVKKEIDYQLEKCNVNTITFSFAARQEHCFSTDIDWRGSFMPDKKQLIQLIEYSKSKKLKVILKPILNVNDGYWRAYIRFFDEDVPCEPKWSEWFKSYTDYLLEYAVLCEKCKVDMLIIGCELVGTDHREKEWRNLINKIREVYSGKITYNCDKYQEHNIKWWDAVDYISSSGYYPRGTFSKELDRIEEVVNIYNKPFFFAEAGCPSIRGAFNSPNDWNVIRKGEVLEEEQYSYYKELFEESSKREFVKGFCLWDWPMKSPKALKGKIKGGYSVKFKKAQQIIAEYYSR